MRAHIIAEDRFLHQNTDHQLFVTEADGAENEYRFEVRRTAPGTDHPETVFEKTEDLSALLTSCPNTTIDQLISAEIQAVKQAVTTEEDEIHAHNP